MSLTDIVLVIIIIFLLLLPMSRRNRFRRRRLRLIRGIEESRRSRVIAMIHRPEALGLMAVFGPMIDIHDSERIIEAIRLTPPEMPIDVVLHTPGGMVLASEQIARALHKHPGKVTVFVPYFAMSGGTLIALAADEVCAGPNSVMGPLDPTIGFIYPAASIIRAAENKRRYELDDRTLILLDDAYRARDQLQGLVYELLVDKYGDDKAMSLARALTDGRWTHDFPLTPEKMTALGIELKTFVPDEITELARMSMPTTAIPTVEFFPVKYGRVRGDK